MRFAHLKTHHRFERMRLRGLSGARDEFHLAAIVQNLKTLAKHIWRPMPHEVPPALHEGLRLRQRGATAKTTVPPQGVAKTECCGKCSNAKPRHIIGGFFNLSTLSGSPGADRSAAAKWRVSGAQKGG